MSEDKYNNLINFWDNAFNRSSEQKEEFKKSIKEDTWLYLAPSEKLFQAAKSISCYNNVLDYGCGSGWASIIISKNKVKHILSVDVSKNGIDLVNIYKDIYKLDNLDTLVINKDWLKTVPSNTFDALICSNVLDVLPFDITKDIIKEFHRILKKDSKVVIGLNFYITEEMKSTKKLDLVNDELYVDGILRLLNKSDDEWKKIFNKYFEIEKLEYFAWPNETKETRRLFYLKK